MSEQSHWYLDTISEKDSATSSCSVAINSLREAAILRLKTAGLPTSQEEDWKYTDIREVRSGDFKIAKSDSALAIEKEVTDKLNIQIPDSFVITSVNGYVAPHLSSLNRPDGVVIGRVLSAGEIELIGESTNKDSIDIIQKALEKNIGTQTRANADSISALNDANLSEVIVLVIKKGVRVKAPIVINHTSLPETKNTAIFSRVLILAEESSEISIVEHYSTLSDATSDRIIDNITFHSSVTEIVTAKNSIVNHYQIGDERTAVKCNEREYKGDIRFSRIAANLDSDSSLNTVAVSFGGKLIRNEVQPTLNGTGSFVGMYGLSVLTNGQHVDNHTLLDHAKPHCESDEMYKGIYDGNSKGVFCGTIIVRPDAQKTNAIQSNQGILLSDKASLSTRPQLKIWADDVKCTHGATVGQLDQQQLFYLRSRGIGERAAKGMLLRAFAGDVTQKIKIPALRTYVEEKLVGKLNIV